MTKVRSALIELIDRTASLAMSVSEQMIVL